MQLYILSLFMITETMASMSLSTHLTGGK